MQFSKQFLRYLVRKERPVVTRWVMNRNWSDGELPTVLSNQGVKEILGFNGGSAALLRRPEGRENEPPGPIRIPLEHGSIMLDGRGLGQFTLSPKRSISRAKARKESLARRLKELSLLAIVLKCVVRSAGSEFDTHFARSYLAGQTIAGIQHDLEPACYLLKPQPEEHILVTEII